MGVERRRPRIRWAWLIAISLAGGVIVAVRSLGTDAVGRGFLIIFMLAAPVGLVVNETLKGARPSVGSVGAATIAGSSQLWVFSLHVHWFVRALLLACVTAPLLKAANTAFRADLRRAQGRRDLLATTIATALERGASPVRRYSLYLRPFDTTDRLVAQSLGSVIGTETGLPQHLDAESLLVRALRKDCPLIALGRPGRMLEAAGRIIVVREDAWQTKIDVLAQHASIALIVPSEHAGTLWELRRLVDRRLLGQTLFLMPEQPRQTPSGVAYTYEGREPFKVGAQQYREGEHTYDIRKEWEKVRVGAQDIPLHLPAYAAAGALFTLEPESRRVARIAPLALSVLSWRVYYLKAVISSLGLVPWRSTAAGIGVADAFEAAAGHGRTLEYALVAAADAYLAWGDAVRGTDFLRRAAAAVRTPRFTIDYVNSREAFVRDLLTNGQATLALPYLEAALELYTSSLDVEVSIIVRAQTALEDARNLRDASPPPAALC